MLSKLTISPPDFEKWANNLTLKNLGNIYRIEKDVAKALKQAYEQGITLGKRLTVNDY